MLGIIVGAALVYGTYRFFHRHHRGGYGRGFRHRGGHDWGPMPSSGRPGWGHGPGGSPWRMRARGLERMVGSVATRLEATPEQYRVIRNEAERFADKTQELRGEFRLSRDDMTNAMRGESFDEEIMGEGFARQDDRIREVREQLVGALARIHDVLEPHQRERLAHLSGQFGHRGGWR